MWRMLKYVGNKQDCTKEFKYTFIYKQKYLKFNFHPAMNFLTKSNFSILRRRYTNPRIKYSDAQKNCYTFPIINDNCKISF